MIMDIGTKLVNCCIALLVVGIVATIPCPRTTWAKDSGTISLEYFEFDQSDEPEPVTESGHPVKMPKKAMKKTKHATKTELINKLQSFVLKQFKEPQNGYIQLSDTEFIIFASNTVGFYLADLSTNTISEDPFMRGDIEIESVLKDKSGDGYLLLSHSYPMHGGSGGGSYSLLSARMSGRGKAITDLIDLGSYEFYDDDIGNVCKEKKNAGRVINNDVNASVTDINKDGYPDITITLERINCKTKKTTISQTTYFASSHGFKSIVSRNPNDIVTRLLKAQKQALEIFSRTKDRATAGRALEKAGVGQFLYDKPDGMSTAAYAALLNDFAFFWGPYWKERQAVDILDRVILMSPNRAVAYLNRAEPLYQMLSLSELKTQDEKINTAKEIMRDYLTYKRLGGKIIEQWENFTAFNLSSYPRNISVCEYIKKYQNAGRFNNGLWRLEEIYLETHRLDINNDGHIDDVEFEPGKYGYKTYGEFSIRDSKGNQIKFNNSVSRKPDTGYGFNVFVFEGKVYKLLPLLDISYVDRDRERLVCESEWEEIGDGTRVLKFIKKID